MGKKVRDEVEELEKQIKELKSTNRVLRKRLKKLEGLFQQKEIQDIENELAENAIPTTRSLTPDNTPTICPNCESPLTTIKTAGRRFERCSRQATCFRTKAVMED